MDSLLAVEAEGYNYRLKGWSGDAPDMPLFVGDQYRPMVPKRVERVDDGLLLVLDSEVDPDDQVFWEGEPCTLTLAESIWPTKLVARRDDGTVASLFQRREEAKRVVLVVEGCAPVVLEDERGTELPHRMAEPHEGATRLRVGREEIPWNGQRTLTLEEPPDQDFLLADNGVRWAWADDGGRGRRQRGVWIQLLPPDEVDSEAALDIRTAYMEEGVREVHTKKGNNPQHAFKVWGFQRDNYRLELDRLPPEGSTFFIPSSTSGLQRQRQAVFRFKDNPLPHHGPLLRLCEAPDKVHWPKFRPKEKDVSHWYYLLNDEHWWGTSQQREFVEKALGTPDFAFLEGPPGSGKTHAICELVLQFIDRGLNVLLCSTTHVAVDNVLERLVGDGEFEQVEAVRIGLADRVDQTIRTVQIDERISALVETWRDVGTFADLDTATLERVAEATILSSVNLTCGTSTGILAHPYIRRSDAGRDNDTGPSWPYFDVLIIDEASKTTFQEFLVPAQLARKWIVVGDVRQLPPFSEPKDLEASIAEVSDANDAMLSDAQQAALLILFRLQRPEAGVRRVRWLIEESNDVLDALSAEIEARTHTPEIVRVVQGRSVGNKVSIADIEAGQPVALHLLAADWILFPPKLRNRLAPYLPPDGLALRDWGPDSARAYQFVRWLEQRGRFKNPVREQRRQFQTADELAARQRGFLREESWAKQVSWRLGRVHQLASARDERQSKRRQDEVDSLMPAVEPYSKWVPLAIDAIRDVGVRSVIESFRVRRSNHRVRRLSALTEALPTHVWNERAVLIEYQHRMHPDISKFPREQFYEGVALKDANTLDGRDKRDGWSFMPKVPARRVWVDVRGHEERGVNQAEIKAMQSWLETWRDYAKTHPRTDGKPWTVACLSFYHRQELETRNMLRRLTRMQRAETRFALPNTTIVCATVDRFQGREADLVLLSLRNTSRPGHMDSPNRLNVGVTRARFLLVILGHRKYFADCPSEELNALANATPLFSLA